ncbi:glycosyltransferase family 4 protein [Streptomyces sp. Q6]|uniref:Glycosyltransferase family 4 protein n=1 Tax=Streptomyces citrinus TaxID=3118173 RepID=A0ACD5AEN2_9ACTN
MRIAFVHRRGGDDEAVLGQAAALGRAGHDVHLVAADADDLRRTPGYATARRTVTVTTGHGGDPVAALRALRPDVVHVHHVSADPGRSWVADWTGPLVATLHDHHPPCASAGLHRDGRYGGSRGARLPLAWASRGGTADDPLLRRADRLIVLSETSRARYTRAGVAPERLALVPHFVPDGTRGAMRPEPVWVYAGRLAQEQGITELLRRWPAGQRLDVFGGGPRERECRAAAPDSVTFRGVVEHAGLVRRLGRYQGLVLPGRFDDGLPLVYSEALAAGLPVLAFDGSPTARTVRAEGTGTVASWDASLPAALRAASLVFPTLRAHCRARYEETYGETQWVTGTERLYAAVVRAGAREFA